ncbi:MAG: dynamin family protein [Treponema sp.]|nr:dynamin family protein [Treponema sp.]
MPKNIDEQKTFRRMNVSAFFESQVIHDRKDRAKYNERYTASFKKAFDDLMEKRYDESPKSFKKLKRKCFQWLLYEEFVFYCKAFGVRMDEETMAKAFKFGARKFKSFLLAVERKLPKSKLAAKSYAEFTAFRDRENEYAGYEVKNIAVCATMSAGKSTFVNALLGSDVLPSRNEATTAKITSVYDKDGAEKTIGFVQKDSGAVVDKCSDVNLAKLNEWNDSNEINRIFLQGDLDGIRNKGLIVAVHDTPGTNNSGDKSHHTTTINFLKENKMDAIIYVANATQLCTTDEKVLLAELFRKVIKPTGIPVVFVLNKADDLDTEKENVSDIVKRYSSYLAEFGFVSPVVFPLSSKAARLLKMAQNGKAGNMTAKETRAFNVIKEQFKDVASTGINAVEDYIENLF